MGESNGSLRVMQEKDEHRFILPMPLESTPMNLKNSNQVVTIGLLLVVDDRSDLALVAKCLVSSLPLADSWCIVDLRDDQTDLKSLLEETFADMPGGVVDGRQMDRAAAQSEGLTRLRKSSDYSLLLAESTEVCFDLDYNVVALKATLNRSAYRLTTKSGSRHCAQLALLNNAYEFYFRGAVFPMLDCHDTVESVGHIDGIFFEEDSPTGQRSADEVAVLESAFSTEPDRLLRVHFASVIARAHSEMGQYSKAQAWFEQVVQLGNSGDEICEALLRAGHCARDLLRPSSEVLDLYMRAHDANPHRAEPLYYAARVLREDNRLSLAHLFAQAALKKAQPEIVNCLETDVYDWKALFEFSFVAYYVGDHQAGFNACKELLTNPALSEADRMLTRKNLNHYIRALTDSESAG